ncbi:MAG: hypothetical protein J3R72DRAFT_499432 [Linnemannia gamsii]|nr:MAG: hypothetical protein J3R72DRAFT_499432 [Linnemannia gamsii]
MLYATAFRHKDFRRCTMGAFAFYMLQRFMINNESVPDFSDADKWKEVKVLVPSDVPIVPDLGSGPDAETEHQLALEKLDLARTGALTGRAQQLATAAVMRACEIFSVRLTHAGRHAGCKEAFKLGLGIEDIQHLGRWVVSQMMSFYAPKNPIKGAYFMAHFNGTDEPCILERDLVPPPPELQRMLFGWIEHVFDSDGSSDETAEAWHATCLAEMTGYDPDEITKEDIFFEAKSNISAAQSGIEQSAHMDKIAFLKLLVRMRRVIIQDAVLCIQLVPGTNRILSNSLIEKLPKVFESALFLDYSKDLILAIQTLEAMEAKHQKQLDQNEARNAQEITRYAQEIARYAQETARLSQAMAAMDARYARMEQAYTKFLPTVQQQHQQHQQQHQQQQQHNFNSWPLRTQHQYAQSQPPLHPQHPQHPDHSSTLLHQHQLLTSVYYRSEKTELASLSPY